MKNQIVSGYLRKLHKTLVMVFSLALFLQINTGLAQTDPATVKGYEALQSSVSNNSKQRVIVKLKDHAADDALRPGVASSHLENLSSLARAHDIEEVVKIPRFNMAVYEVDASELDTLLASGVVEGVYEDKLVVPLLNYSLPFIQANKVHMENINGAGQAVAILDSGVDLQHPAFAGRVVAEACFSNADNVNSFSLCPNGLPQESGPGTGDDCYAVYQHSDCTHGTHVAGIASAFDSTISGVAPSADIVSVQVFHRSSSGPRIYASTTDMILALQWVLENAETHNIAAVNMSIGGGVHTEYCDDEPIKVAIDALRNADVATVIASGNDGEVGSAYPGCVSSAVTVAATYRDSDLMAAYSNISTLVDLAAPGSSIYAPIPNARLGYKSGTSMAAPHVAGAFALLRSATPEASVSEIEQALVNTGNPVLDTNSGTVFPRVNVFAAYESLSLNDDSTLSVSVETSTDWNTGYCADIYLENTGSEPITWGISLEVEGTVNSLWNGNWSQSGSTLQISGTEWNVSLQPGQMETSLGFCANR